MPYEKEIQILSELRSEYSCFDPNEREYYHALSEAIRSLKTVDAEPVRHGRWVNHISENGATDGTYCDICDYEVDRDARYNYCPNCGAKMDESTMGQVKPSDKEFTLYANEKPIVTFKDSKIVLHGERKEDD